VTATLQANLGSVDLMRESVYERARKPSVLLIGQPELTLRANRGAGLKGNGTVEAAAGVVPRVEDRNV
jgi:hypothetical protein